MKTGRLMRVGLLLVTVTLLCQGCGMWKKYSANSAIKKVKETLERAKQEEANRYAPDLFTTAQSLITKAEGDVTEGNYEEALNKTNQAESKALDAIKNVPENRQTIQRKSTALTDLQKEIQATMTKAENSPSRSVAETEITQARESLDAISGEIQQLTRKPAQRPEEYDTKMEELTAVGDTVQKAYNLTLTDAANSMAETLQAKVDLLNQLEFSTYMPDEAGAAGAEYGRFTAMIEQKDYEPALALGEALSATLEQVVPAARKARAIQSTKKADEQLALAANLGGLEFAPEQLKAGQDVLAQARAKLEAAQYNEAYDLAVQGIMNANVAMDEIKQAIEDQIDVIQNKIVEAEETGAAQFAPQKLEEGRARLADAFNTLTDKDYQSARNLQQQAAAAVEMAFQAAKKGRAKEKLDRVDEILAEAKKQGAETYVPQSLLSAQGKLNEAKAIFNKGDYVDVHPVADLAENLAYKTIADLKEKTGEKIAAAEKQIAAAQEAVGGYYSSFKEDLDTDNASSMLQTARAQLNQAKTELAGSEYLTAIQAADKAFGQARASEAVAYQIGSEKMLVAGRQQRDLALQSGAKDHSAALFLDAVNKMQEAEKLLAAKTLKKALATATAAEEGFRAARMSKIKAATQNVTSAVDALAEKYDPTVIANAQGLLAEAKISMDAGEYATSNQKADQAAQLAAQSEQTTWNKRGTDQIALWEKQYAIATTNFAAEKAPEAYKRSKAAGVEAKAEFAVQNFRSAYENAVRATNELDRVNQILAAQTSQTMNVINTKIGNLKALAIDTPGRNLITGLIEMAAKARQAQSDQNFQAVFTLEKEFMTVYETTEHSLKAHNLNSKREGLLQELAELRDRGITNFLKDDTSKLEKALNELNVDEAAKDYSSAVAQLQEQANQLKQFPSKADVQLQQIISTMQKQLTEARQAGALDVIPAEYASAVQAYKLVLNYPKDQGGNYNELYDLVASARDQSQNAFDATNLGIQVRTYDENVQSYIGEMNSLLDTFSTVTDFSDRMLIASSSSRSVDVYNELQYDLNATALRRRSQLLRDKALQLQPPAPRAGVHKMTVKTFEELVKMAELFERFGEYEKYDKQLRDQYITEAYKRLQNVKDYTSKVQTELLAPNERRGKLNFLNPANWGS